MLLTQELPQVPPARLVFRLLRIEVEGLLRRSARGLGVRRPRAMSPDELAIPDSTLVQRATSLARAVEPDFVFHHSVRTYLYGVAIGHNLGLRVDREILFLASILHDLGLAPEHDGAGSFELHSAQAAHTFLRSEGIDEARAAMVHEAIALHSSVGIAGAREPEIALTHFGAGVDVIGFRREDVADETNDAILRAWPREAFKERFAALLRDQARRKPGCHIAGAMKVGFERKLRGAPFSE